MATEEGTDAAFDSFQYQLGSLKLPREASNDLYQLLTKDNPDVPAGQTLDNRSIIIGSKITNAHFEATTVGSVGFLLVCVVRCVVFYMSVLLCGARVFDDVSYDVSR